MSVILDIHKPYVRIHALTKEICSSGRPYASAHIMKDDDKHIVFFWAKHKSWEYVVTCDCLEAAIMFALPYNIGDDINEYR